MNRITILVDGRNSHRLYRIELDPVRHSSELTHSWNISQCSLLIAQGSVLNAQCTMFKAQCSMLNILFQCLQLALHTTSTFPCLLNFTMINVGIVDVFNLNYDYR